MKFSSFASKLKNKAWTLLKDHFYQNRLTDSNIIQNINFNSSQNQKKLLICYKTQGYFIDLRENTGRTLFSEIFKMVTVFSGLNFCIDIIDCNDTSPLKTIASKKYNVIFGFGETFYQITTLQPEAISILYMTENHPSVSFREEKKRLDYFYERHGIHVKFQRSGKYYKLKHLDRTYADIITLSDTETLLPQYSQPYSLFPTGLVNSQFSFKTKGHSSTRKNFLWLGSQGAIHKGLDLLIDIFKERSDITLHICGLNAHEKKLLHLRERTNIIDHGFINIQSPIFLQLVDECSYIILPSCSEAFSTSISTGMLHGLIPVVMRNAGFNKVGNHAIFLDDFKLNYLDIRLNELSNASPEDLQQLSKKTFSFAQEHFLLSHFEQNFRAIITEILYKHRLLETDINNKRAKSQLALSKIN
jgi:hypothetical protein